MVRVGTMAAVVLVLLGTACEYGRQELDRPDNHSPSRYVWPLPEGFPAPRVPPDNPMTTEKVELGRHLFHDPRLSGDGTVSCASCHQPELAYTDGRSRAVGSQGNIHPRSAMSLTNVAYNATLGWDDPSLIRLEDQALVPLFNTQPLEMGVAGRENVVLVRFRGHRRYRQLFFKAFPEDKDPVTMRNVIYALASFERTLISGNSPYDRWAYGGEVDALNPDERAGARLFFSRRVNCFRCHAGFNFSGPVVYEGSGVSKPQFHNTGLYNEDRRGAYPKPNTGVHRHSGRSEDMGKFRAPTLRNIALTAPYMHDGSVATLEAVLDHYAAGGRARSFGLDTRAIGPGSATDPLITGFELTPEERRQMVAFLRALTDESFVRRARQ
ncbi:MAG: di-heme enzyme [Deltaproteobacteria bacterium]|nr:MAG: di-heme enzyme [Deltaproteobacteria bacterium]